MQGKERKKFKSREMKIAMFYEGWQQVGKDRYELVNKNVVCGFDSVRDFADKKEAKISSIYNTDEINMRIFNSDGAAWIKKLHIDDTVHFQLDRFHVKQAILRATRDERIQKNITELYENQQIDEMLVLIDAYANSVDDEKQEGKLRQLYTYLSENKDGLIPYQKQTLELPTPPQGLEYRCMGTCEHNVDLVIAKRMKHRGASWSIDGAENLGKLLALKASKKLSETLEQIAKVVLSEAVTDDIITVLSASKTAKTEGKGYGGNVYPRPYANAFKTDGRKAIDNMLDLRAFSDLVLR
jgi:hypothetical protein